MAAGDIDVIFTADDRDVSEGLNRLAKKAGGFSAEMAKATGKVKEQLTGFKNIGPAVGGAIAAGMALATKAVTDYADKNDLVAGQITRMKAASAELWTGIGRDISGLLGGEAADFLRWVEKVRGSTVDAVAGLFSSDAGEVTAAQKQTEAMMKQAKETAAIEKEKRAIRAEVLSLQGDEVAAAKVRAAIERESALERINAMNLTSGPEKDSLIRAVRMKEEEQVRAAIRKKAEQDAANLKKLQEEDARGDAADRERREREAEQQATARLAAEDLAMQLEAAKIEAMRGSLKKEEVEEMERELKLRKEIQEIQRNELLTADQKAAAVDTLRTFASLEGRQRLAEQAREGRIGRGAGETLESGILGSSRTFAAAIGGGPQMAVATQTRDATIRTAKAVEAIAARGLAAVLG